MSVPGVVGTALGAHQGKPCIKVYVTAKTPALADQLPSALDGHQVVLEETGEIKALETD